MLRTTILFFLSLFCRTLKRSVIKLVIVSKMHVNHMLLNKIKVKCNRLKASSVSITWVCLHGHSCELIFNWLLNTLLWILTKCISHLPCHKPYQYSSHLVSIGPPTIEQKRALVVLNGGGVAKWRCFYNVASTLFKNMKYRLYSCKNFLQLV